MRNDKSFIYELPLEEYGSEELPMYEYDRRLDELENLKRKSALIQYAGFLVRQKEYNDAILYFKYLSNNTYFINDYYPYRQLAMIYEKTEDYAAGMVNIKRLLHAKIYLNEYQFIWFTDRMRRLIEKTSVDEYEVQKWFDYYQYHGALAEKKLNRFLADRFIRKDDVIIVISEDEFDHRQERLALEKTGRIYESVGNYELAVRHYSNIISAGGNNCYQFYQRLCLCLEELGDYERELKVIRLYFNSRLKNRNSTSDKWFDERLERVKSKMKSSLDYYFTR